MRLVKVNTVNSLISMLTH